MNNLRKPNTVLTHLNALTVGSGLTRYSNFLGSTPGTNATSPATQVSFDCILDYFEVITEGTSGASGTITFDRHRSGVVDTTATITIAANSAAGRFTALSDSSFPYKLTPSVYFGYRIVNSSGATTPSYRTIAYIYN